MATFENPRLLVDGARGSDLGFLRGIYRIATFVTDLNSRFTSWNNTRKTRNELVKLSDRALDDIGLTRGDIETFSFGRISR